MRMHTGMDRISVLAKEKFEGAQFEWQRITCIQQGMTNTFTWSQPLLSLSTLWFMRFVAMRFWLLKYNTQSLREILNCTSTKWLRSDWVWPRSDGFWVCRTKIPIHCDAHSFVHLSYHRVYRSVRGDFCSFHLAFMMRDCVYDCDHRSREGKRDRGGSIHTTWLLITMRRKGIGEVIACDRSWQSLQLWCINEMKLWQPKWQVTA